MPVIPRLIKRLNTKRIRQIDHFRLHPADTQEQSLRRLLEKASSTEWGVKYNYSSITDSRQYISVVPLQTYEDIVPWVDRLRAGEKDLLWPGEIRWFAKSSGTTSSKSKFIPVSEESLEECHFQAARDILAIYTLNNPGTRIFFGKALTLGGSHRINKFSNQSLYGDLSAILIENAPSWVELIRTPEKKIALTEDFEEKLDLITKITVNENVTNFSGVPSWYLTLIKHILAYTGKSNLLDVWPNLEVFFHGGISFTPYRELYRELIAGDQMHYMETYNASEGFFGIQDDPSKDDMLLMLDYGIFYEFIPSCEVSANKPASLLLPEVEKGVNYAIVISTNGGLWRYMIGDTIMFTSTNPYRFRITGRTRNFINAFGEELIMENADRAIEEACRATGAIITEYTAGPVFMGASSKGTHEWIIEFEKQPSDPEKFIEVLDETLKSVNSDYEAKRFRDINLVRPLVRIVPHGTFNVWMKHKNKMGGQNKVPRLANTREYIEELYEITGMKMSEVPGTLRVD
jgi:hypothetical protein